MPCRCTKSRTWTPGSLTAVAVGLAACLIGCFGTEEEETILVPGGDGTPVAAGDLPQFSLAWSEYPSWSAFGVAAEEDLLNGDAGALGEMEKKWGVDVVLKQTDYDTCIQLYGDGQIDAVCLTNMDLLPLTAGRPAVVTLPTSTSVGGDALLTVGIDSVQGLKGVDTRGLGNSVSEYVFERCLEKRGENPAEYSFKSMDPDAAALAMQGGQLNSVVVWNPFLLSTERNTPGVKRLFDTAEIPEEVIDLVGVSKDSLAKPGGEAFAACLADTFYAFNERLAGADRDELLVALGEKFSNLGVEDMKLVTTQTRFFDTAAAGKKLLADAKFRDETMPRVAAFVAAHGDADAPPVGFDDDAAALNFTAKYIDRAAAGPAK